MSEESPIRDLCSLISRGVTPAYDETGILVLNQKCVRDNRVSFEAARLTNPDRKKVPREKLLQLYDVLVNSTGVGTLGRVGQVKTLPGEVTVDSHVSIVRPDPAKIDPKFFGYAMVLNQPRIEAMGEGATGQTELSRARLGQEVAILRPPLPEQRRIADILSAYDELIENSQRRIRILEEMARALYREWFAHFRFPGHEDHRRVASPLGDIPEGWDVRKLAAVADVNRAQIQARSAPQELHYVDISSVSPGRIESITTYAYSDAPGRARRIVQHGDVLWSCVRPNRRSHVQVMHPVANTIASTGFSVLTAKKVPYIFLYLATTTEDFVSFLTNNATGAAYPAVTAATFERAELLIPPPPLLAQFGILATPMAEQIHVLQLQVRNLGRMRDLLLPRLLTGQVELEEA